MDDPIKIKSWGRIHELPCHVRRVLQYIEDHIAIGDYIDRMGGFAKLPRATPSLTLIEEATDGLARGGSYSLRYVWKQSYEARSEKGFE